MSEDKHYGLTINEQAFAMWITCRFQGFPDFYTDVPYRGKPAADSPRYKALGNSMAVPVMRWIGERIEAVKNSLPTGWGSL